MKRLQTLSVFLLLLLISYLTLALKATKIADDVWTQLGITSKDGISNLHSSIQTGSLSYFGAKNAAGIPIGSRTAVINQLVAQAKKYIASDEFKRRYENERKLRMPKEPELFQISVDEIRAKEKQRIEQAIKQTEANANHPNPKIKNGVPKALENLNAELKTVDDPNNKNVQREVKQLEAWNNAALAQHKSQLQKLDIDFPQNPQELIKRRLQQMLDVTADVDYNAELKEVGKFKVFVNPAYEKKSKDWKLAFRAGKETTEAIRAVAQKWLLELK